VPLWYFPPWLSRNKNTHVEEVYRALIDNSRALNNVDKVPYMLALHYIRETGPKTQKRKEKEKR